MPAAKAYELRVRAPQACCVAVFDHQVDGSTVLFFPNNHADERLGSRKNLYVHSLGRHRP